MCQRGFQNDDNMAAHIWRCKEQGHAITVNFASSLLRARYHLADKTVDQRLPL